MELWQGLKEISSGVAGDFNNVLNLNERMGSHVTLIEVLPLRDCIRECGVSDHGVSGPFFTWNYKQDADDRVHSKIDRMLSNDAGKDLFPDANMLLPLIIVLVL